MAPVRNNKRTSDEATTSTQSRRTSKRLKSHQNTQEDEAKAPTEPQESKGKGTSSSSTKKIGSKYPTTPDGHYFVVRGRLWRCADPSLIPSDRDRWTKALMSARRDVGTRGREGGDVKEARDRVQEAKEALGERGNVWWDEGEVCDRKMVWNTGYKDWWEVVGSKEAEAGEA